MRFLFKFWLWLFFPPKFYGGGGGNRMVPTTNPEEEKLAAISQEKWDEYKQRYAPLENEWIAQVQTKNDPNFHQAAEGLTAGEIRAQAGDQTNQVGQSMVGGKTPVLANYNKIANDTAQATNKASLGVTDAYLKNIQNVIAVGQGQSTQAVNGMADVARQSVEGQVGNMKNSYANQQSNNSTLGAVAGGITAAASNQLGKAKK